jgi:ABC-type phosphate/phosphonate transport system permease subunit
MKDAFIAGGFGMYPTLLAGLALLIASIQYARRPERRYVPLLLALGLFTLLAGSLGTITGVMTCLHYYVGPVGGQDPMFIAAGVEEALHNMALALLLSVLSALFASVGAWRLSRQPELAAAR